MNVKAFQARVDCFQGNGTMSIQRGRDLQKNCWPTKWVNHADCLSENCKITKCTSFMLLSYAVNGGIYGRLRVRESNFDTFYKEQGDWLHCQLFQKLLSPGWQRQRARTSTPANLFWSIISNCCRKGEYCDHLHPGYIRKGSTLWIFEGGQVELVLPAFLCKVQTLESESWKSENI